MAKDIIERFVFPKLQIEFTKDEVIDYLQVYQDWRRGADTEQPDPTTLGYVIDEAIKLLKEYDIEDISRELEVVGNKTDNPELLQ